MPAFVSITITPKQNTQNSGGNATGSNNANQADVGAKDTSTGSKQPAGKTSANTYNTSCLKKLSVDTQIDEGWLKRSVSGAAVAANINAVEVFISSSDKSQDGYVSCHYKSAKGDIYNLVYKFPCKNATVIGTNIYSCEK